MSTSALRRGIHIEIRQPPGIEASAVDSQPILDFIASDESLDRYHEIISASGWRLDTYRRNPVFQNAHQYGDIIFTLGRALITEVRGHPRPSDGRGAGGEGIPYLYQRIQFATDVNPIARIAYGLYQGKFLNAVSVGFIPLRWLDANGDEQHSGLAKSQPGRRSAAQHFHRKYLEQELLEVSAVGIPANPNALALALKSGAIEKADLLEALELLNSLCRSRNISPPRPFGPNLSSRATLSNLQPSTCNLELLFLARQLRGLLRRA
jgi:hypothetical protein